MTVRRTLPAPAVLAVLALLTAVAPALVSCQLLEGGGSAIDDALEVVPADARSVSFLDREAQAERLGIDDLETGASEEERSEYVELLTEERVPTTPLGAYVQVMQDAALSEFDVVWWVRASVDDGVLNAYELDDVDYDELVGDLEEAGIELEEDRGRYTAEPADPSDVGPDPVLEGGYPVEFALGLFLDPDENLLVTGSAADVVADVLDDDRDSAVDEETFDDLLDGAEPEHAEITTEPSCRAVGELGPELVEELGAAGLGAPEAAAYLAVADDDEVTESGVLRFADGDAARDDVEAREAYLADGTSLTTRVPVSDLGTAELDREGDLVRMELDLEQPGTGVKAFAQSDAFFACGP